MCGIGGVVTWDQRHRFEPPVLVRMSACIAHRGPDGSGEYLNHDQLITSYSPQCGLVHRRLAIIDPDARSNQPFHDGTRQQWITFNGEIFNYQSLKKEISSVLPRYKWRTKSDTEVLLAAYLAWGEACVEKLNGQFAFAIWDEPAKTLFFARDPMGQKPLYYAAVGSGGKAWAHEGPPMAIAFASELSALKQMLWMDSSINHSALADYLRFGWIPTPATIYNGAWKLPPGSWMKISTERAWLERYFDPNNPGAIHPTGDEPESQNDQSRPASGLQHAGSRSASTASSNKSEDSPNEDMRAEARTPVDFPARTRQLVTQAVKCQLVSDVPLGCFLSGGIDSSIVAASMKLAVPKKQPVMTFSIGFDDPLYDETKYAAEVAKHLGTTHHEFTVECNAADDLPKLARVFGEPFGDSSALPTHYLSRATREHVKVALSGDGGDELFGGYDRYRAMQLSESVRKLPAPLRAIAGAKLWQLLPGTHPKSKLARLKRLLATLRQPAAARYESYLRLFDDSMIRALLPAQKIGEPVLAFGALFAEQMKERDVVRAAGCVDRLTYLPDDLLTKLDRASMLHALEVRSPFMDPDLVHFAAGLTTPQLLEGGGKRMLREAFSADLPATVFTRQKMGFAVPIGQWFRTSLGGMLRGILFASDSFTKANFNVEFVKKLVDDHHHSKADHSQRLYALLMLELWWRGTKDETVWV